MIIFVYSSNAYPLLKSTIKKNLFTVKPRYFRNSPLPPCHVIDKLQEEISKKSFIEGITQGNDATLNMAESDVNFWSPEFKIHVSKRGKGSTIKGVLGPNSKFKTLLILLSTLALVLFFLGILMIINQLIFGMQSPITWSVPVGLLIALFTFVFAKIALIKSSNQMELLWKFTENAIDAREKKQKELLDELFPGEDVII